MDSSEEEEEEDEKEEEEVGDGKDPADDSNWDDTICSNRSAYFKKYYSQRGVIGRSAEDKESGFKSPFGTSHNSLSSLIREKMGKTPPQDKSGIQIGLVVLVVVLLVVIVVGISLTSYFYHLHLLELFIFKCIKFYEETRILEMYDESWKPIITLHLGTNLPQHSIPNECTDYLDYLKGRNYSLPHHGLNDENYDDMICLDWTSLAQVHLRKIHSAGSVQCYSVWWLALKDDFTLRDCLMPNPWEDKERNITWWGGGEMTSGGYPVTQGNVPPTRMITGRLDRDPWGQLLRRTWISDRATLLMLPARFPGNVSVNHHLDRQVCLEVPVTPCTTYDPNLSYTLCKAPNLTALAGYLHQRAVQERRLVSLAVPSLVKFSEVESQHNNSEDDSEMTVLRETFAKEVVTRVEERLDNPVWIPWMTPDSPHLTQAAVLSYVDRVLTNATGLRDEGLTNTTEVLGHVLLPASWQKLPGEMEFDQERFPDPVGLSQALKANGFHLALTVHPFVSVDATGFKPGLSEGLWVKQQDSLLPALARYDERYPSVVTDFSNLRARQWYASQLQKLKEKYEIDRFHVQPADGYALPTFHEYHKPVHSSDDTLVLFMAAVSSVSPPVSTEGAVMPPLPPTFVTMGTGDGSWDGLETLVPRLLTLTMLGYPFIDVGPIGGLARPGHVPDRELYIRWIEAATFLPAMQVSVLPITYDEEVQEIAREYMDIRKELVLPRLKEKVHDALDKGTPLITPLALFVPDDTEAGNVGDQWMLGNDLLVAPVIRRGERSRTFYLPKGIWKDGIDGHLLNGGRWVRNYPVPLNKIPHFFLKTVYDFET